MVDDKPINKSLVISSFIVIISSSAWHIASKPVTCDERLAVVVAGAVLVLSPLFVLWFQALWNDLIPRITSWRKISFIEAAGVMIITWFLS